jgi:hypothetical protein
MPNLAQEGDGLQPAKAFFDPLLFLLANSVARKTRRPQVGRAATAATMILLDKRGRLLVAHSATKSAMSKPLFPSLALSQRVGGLSVHAMLGSPLASVGLAERKADSKPILRAMPNGFYQQGC